jgi:glutamine amidotransferase
MIVIIDTGVANRHSVLNALDYIGARVKVSAEAQDIRDAAKLVFPGVGAFAAGMRSLRERGLIDLLNEQALVRRKPILGICLGYQMMAEAGDEGGRHEGLGWIPGTVRRLSPSDPALKVPHTGFNTVSHSAGSRLFATLPAHSDFYFVHSYVLDTDPALVTATVDYGGPVTVAVERDNIMGVQFHPEKSQSTGLALLRAFADMG